MAKKLLSVTVKGERRKWGFNFYGDPKYLDEWRADGLDVVEIVNSIPTWLPAWVPVRWWCFAQDIFNFKWPWSKA